MIIKSIVSAWSHLAWWNSTSCRYLLQQHSLTKVNTVKRMHILRQNGIQKKYYMIAWEVTNVFAAWHSSSMTFFFSLVLFAMLYNNNMVKDIYRNGEWYLSVFITVCIGSGDTWYNLDLSNVVFLPKQTGIVCLFLNTFTLLLIKLYRHIDSQFSISIWWLQFLCTNLIKRELILCS